jgi:hypothetical protein
MLLDSYRTPTSKKVDCRNLFIGIQIAFSDSSNEFIASLGAKNGGHSDSKPVHPQKLGISAMATDAGELKQRLVNLHSYYPILPTKLGRNIEGALNFRRGPV